MRTLKVALLPLLLWSCVAEGLATEDELDAADQAGAGTLFRLVIADRPDEGIGGRLFWRSIPAYVAAETCPVRIQLGGDDVIAPREAPDEGGVGMRTIYPAQGRREVREGEHVLSPGNIPLLMRNGKLSSPHPAIEIANGEVRIRCTCVRLDGVDAGGSPVPISVSLRCGQVPLLRQEARFSPLAIWLPVGVKYNSSLGDFTVTPGGRVEASALAEGVTVVGNGLRLTLKEMPKAAAQPKAPEGKLWLVSHRRRSVFADTEEPVFAIIVSKGFPGGKAMVSCAPTAPTDARPLALGMLPLPAVESGEFDSRQVRIRMSSLPPGDYRLWLEYGGVKSEAVPLTVVARPSFRRSPFFVHTMSGCTGCWPTTDEGLEVLRNAGIEMASCTGHTSLLDTKLPRMDPEVLKQTAGPAELAIRPAPNDVLLERMLRHQIGLIDLTPLRGPGLYLETLSYHHSYKPSVDRVVRHMQVFTQQTADYPSFFGVNYSWFPALFGYAEGGVPCDAHVGDRNRALAETLAAEGYRNPTRDERKWYQENKFADDPATRDKALKIMREAVDYWRAQYEAGFGVHNRLYNGAVRQVRPGTVCTLFENAGHDGGKPTASLFADMDASCYESYTDFGDWPMSAAFVTDWAKGNRPMKPVWLTTCWGTSSEGKMKSLFHAFGRGLDGGGVPMQAEFGLEELARRGTGMAFCSLYGAIATHTTPDPRIAILATDSEQVFGDRTMYAYHAMYYHLTRLGFAPRILADRDVAPTPPVNERVRGPEPGEPSWGADHVKVLFLVRQQQPLEARLRAALEGFQKKGGKIVMTGDCLVKIPGAIVIDRPIKHIWQLSGFEGKCHAEMWDEFMRNWREPLAEAMRKTGVAPLAATDPDRGVVVAMETEPLRYVVVIADMRGSHSNVFEPTEKLPVSLEGTGWIVRDLVKQITLPASERDGRTEVAVDLITEPTTVLAGYKSPPVALRLECHAGQDARLAGGCALHFRCEVQTRNATKGIIHWPVRYLLHDSDGKLRYSFSARSLVDQQVYLPALERPGTWRLTAQELLTGLTATLDVKIEPRANPAVVEPVGDVHVTSPGHLRAFAGREGEKLVIVEPNQARLMPVAKALAEKLKARLWEVKPEEFDTIPVRWYPRPEDTTRLKEVEAGRLIGYRESMQPYINKKTRSHEPERGGYAEIDPPWMVGADCIVFSGGMLAESLRAVTPWMETPNVPGQGQGRLVVCFSPFMADRQVVAVVGNDVEGIDKAAARLATFFPARDEPPFDPKPLFDGKKQEATGTEATPVPQPYRNFTPIRRFRRLLATPEGKAVAILSGKQDTVAFIDEAGTVTGTAATEAKMLPQARIDAQGRLWDMALKVTATHPGWHYPTAHDITLRCIGTDGTLAATVTAYSGDTERLPPDYQGGFPVAPDGLSAAFGMPAGMLLGKLGETAWQRYDDVPHVRFRHEIRTPRFPVGATFSPDSRYVFLTMDTRPRFGGMGYPSFTPTSCEALLLEAPTGRVVWRLREDQPRRSSYAALTGFAAVAKDGVATALSDFDGGVFVVDKAGKVVARDEVAIEGTKDDGRGRLGPRDGVGTWISEDGATAAFGFRHLLVIAHGGRVKRVSIPGLASGGVAPDGSIVVVGIAAGEVRAFRPDGTGKWTTPVGGVAPLVAATRAGILVGTSNGSLILLDSDGKEMRRTHVADAADRGKHEIQAQARTTDYPTPRRYRGPGTLALAKERLSAKQIAAWKPQGEGRREYGLVFHPVTTAIELASPPQGREQFLHLVYRRPEGNRMLRVVTEGKDGREEFLLDLPTPEYRELDVPFRGPGGKVTVSSDGPLEVADCSMWSFRWPSANVAYVRPARNSGAEIVKEEGEDLGGALTELEGDGPAPGAMKDCSIWWFNTDPDSVAGTWLKPIVDPLEAVDGRRFGSGRMKPWASAQGVFAPYRGSWLTVDLKTPTRLKLIATYDRAAKQSEVGTNLAVFSGFDPKDSTSGVVLAGVVGNDQFWRLVPLAGDPVQVLGVQTYVGDNAPSGLSEVEAYK